MTTLAPPRTEPIAAPAVADDSPARRADRSPSESLRLAINGLLGVQHADGHWCAELEGDSILITEYLLMKAILGHDRPPEATPSQLALWTKMLVHLRRLQRDDGTWGQYPGSPADLSATVKAYFTLKLFGDPALDHTDATHMRRARERIHAMGGAEKINTFSMFYVACLGQVSWDACPAIPPESVLLPRWFPFHLTKVAAWTRTMILPLALCSALRPVRRIDSARGIGELFLDQSARNRLNKPRSPGGPLEWGNLFLSIDGALKKAHKLGITPFRTHAIRRAEAWLLERMTPQTTHGLGAIFPPMVYIQIALQKLGYDRSHPVIANAEHELDRFIIELDDHARIQPCFSPVWDTGIALYALTEAGLNAANDPRIDRVCRWLCDHEVTLVGDWAANLRAADRAALTGMGPGHAHGGWAFEYRNEWYPDVDDTAMVCKSLWRASASGGPSARRAREAASRGISWILAMQNDDGGWAAFDRTTHREWMEHVPFADHNAMQDPSCADITGRTLEALITCGVPRHHPSVVRALDYLRAQQRPQGCWWGRWGVNFLYGTWQAVGGLAACGEDPNSPMLRRTLDWLRTVQNPDGGFGESANSYVDESEMGRGPSTPSQTAWGVCAMMELTNVNDPAVRRAIDWLTRHQLDHDAPADPPRHATADPKGLWREPWFTGTGFPKVFYLRYHHYRHYFPVMAIARFVRRQKGAGACA